MLFPFNLDEPKDHSVFTSTEIGVCELTIDIDKITSQFVDTNGKVIDSVIIKKGRRLKRFLEENTNSTISSNTINLTESINTKTEPTTSHPKSEIEELINEYDKHPNTTADNTEHFHGENKEENHDNR